MSTADGTPGTAAVGSVMRQAVLLAVRDVGGADGAALSVLHRSGEVLASAASDDLAQRADALQHAVGEGPCLSAVWDDATVSVPDVGREQRWPRWSRVVQDRCDYRSILVSRLFRTRDRVGALTLWSTTVHGFDHDDVDAATALAAHLAIAVRSAQEVAGLQVALESRTAIGQATGILMERFGISAEQALSLMSRLSSQRNRKLRDLAAEIVTTGTTAGLARPADPS